MTMTQKHALAFIDNLQSSLRALEDGDWIPVEGDFETTIDALGDLRRYVAGSAPELAGALLGQLRGLPSPTDLLRAAITAGLTQQDALEAFAAPADHPAVLAAQEFNEIDEVQVDSRALISPTDDGTWVQAWVWVPADETTEEA